MATPVLDQQRAEAQARVEQAEASLQNLKEALNRPEQIAVLKASLERAEASLVLSQADYERQATLLPKGATTVAQRDQAKFALDRDKAGVAEAQRQIEAALLPSRSHEISAAEATILQNKAQLDEINVRIRRQSVSSPAAGVDPGRLFLAGRDRRARDSRSSALLPPENHKMRIYVPETRLAEFALGAQNRGVLRPLPARPPSAGDLYFLAGGIHPAGDLLARTNAASWCSGSTRGPTTTT